MRLRIIAAPLLAVAGCFGADEPPAADQASPTQTAPDATVSETPVAEGVGQGFDNRGPPFPSTTYALRFPRQAATPTCARSTPAWRAL